MPSSCLRVLRGSACCKYLGEPATADRVCRLRSTTTVSSRQQSLGSAASSHCLVQQLAHAAAACGYAAAGASGYAAAGVGQPVPRVADVIGSSSRLPAVGAAQQPLAGWLEKRVYAWLVMMINLTVRTQDGTICWNMCRGLNGLDLCC